MKKKIAMFMVSCLAFACFNIAPVSAETHVVKVYLDGKLLNYEGVQPQIKSDRAVVPIRETAETHLGMQFSYDEATKTMTFEKNGVVTRHTYNENVIYIDGQMVEFDVPSMIVDERTMMPLTMLSRAVGASQTWVGSSRSVFLVSNAGTTAPKPSAVAPAIISNMYGTQTVNLGSSVELNVTANSYTKSIRLVDNRNKTLATSSNFTQSGSNNVFKISYRPEAVTLLEQRVVIQPGDGTNYFSAGSASVMVLVKKGVEIKSASIDTSSTNVGATVNVTAIGNENATRARVVDENDNVLDETSTISSTNNNETEFNLQFKLEKEGESSFKVYVGSGSGYTTDYKTVRVTADAVRKSEILDVTLMSDHIAVRDAVEVTVRTTNGVEEVKIKDNNGNIKTSTRNYTISGDNHYWKLLYTIDSDGAYEHYVAAYDRDEVEVRRSFKVTVGSGYYGNSNSNASIYRVEVDKPEAYGNESVEVKVYTSRDTNEVYLVDPYGKHLTNRTVYDKIEDDKYVWSLYFSFQQGGRYRAYARDSNNRETSMEFTVNAR